MGGVCALRVWERSGSLVDSGSNGFSYRGHKPNETIGREQSFVASDGSQRRNS